MPFKTDYIDLVDSDAPVSEAGGARIKLTAGVAKLSLDGAAFQTIDAGVGTGTVTSVAATASGLLAVAGTPTVAPTVGLATAAANTMLGNGTAGAAVPTALSAAAARTNMGLVAIASSGSAADLSAGIIPDARMPDLTGDVTTTEGAVATSIAANAVVTAKILDANVTLAKIATQADQTILGNNTGGAASPVALTAAQVRTILGLPVAGDGALLSKVSVGRNGAGALTLTGAVVGMAVRQVLTVTAGALVDSVALFETTITVTDQIQQVSASDLTTITYSFLLQS